MTIGHIYDKQLTSGEARFIANSIIRDLPIKLTLEEWEQLKKRIVTTLFNTTFHQNGALEIDSSETAKSQERESC